MTTCPEVKTLDEWRQEAKMHGHRLAREWAESGEDLVLECMECGAFLVTDRHEDTGEVALMGSEGMRGICPRVGTAVEVDLDVDVRRDADDDWCALGVSDVNHGIMFFDVKLSKRQLESLFNQARMVLAGWDRRDSGSVAGEVH